MNPVRRVRPTVFVTLGILPALFSMAPAADGALDRYAAPERLVAIDDGHRLNLRCSGNGSPTVLLEAGGASDSSTWYLVLPLVAKATTVCSYDRAGYGYSDEGTLPRTVEADVRDLDLLVDRAGLRTPLVVVGHSLGTNIARRYAALHAEKVAALVLIDPSAQNVADTAPAWARREEAAGVQRDAMLTACLTGAEAGTLAAPPPALKGCLRGPDPAFDDRVNAAQRANKLRPAFWHTLMSELNANVDLFKQPVPAPGSPGAMPLIVLVAADTYADVAQDDRRLLESARNSTVARILSLSTHSRRIDVAHSSHDVQIDHPKRVADAVADAIAMTAAARAVAPPRQTPSSPPRPETRERPRGS